MTTEFKLVPVEPTDEMKKAIYGLLSAYDDGSDITPAFFMKMLINAATTPPQPIYDENAERSACRKEWVLRNKHSHFEPVPFPDYWAGWKDCAQSRAKAGEVGHE